MALSAARIHLPPRPMPVSGPVPSWLLTLVAAATLFTVLLDIGLSIVIGEWRWVFGQPRRLAKALAATLLLLPPIALGVTQALDLAWTAEIGIMLMSIAPGAPVALRRSLGAGGDRAFAPALQIIVALLAVVVMPAWVFVLNAFYAGHAWISPTQVARQAFAAQLLPLCIGILVRMARPSMALWLEPRLRRLATALLVLFAALALLDIWRDVLAAGPRAGIAVVLITIAALALGHALGGPDRATRTAVAISTAARNPGLALLVASLNHAPPGVMTAILAYVVISAVSLLPYVVWRKHGTVAGRALDAEPG